MHFSTVLAAATLLLTQTHAAPTATPLSLADAFAAALAKAFPDWGSPSRGWQSNEMTPQLPASTLPTPPAGTALKYIALGVGTQNYTCAAADPTLVPTAVGAVANLYDFYRVAADARYGQDAIQQAPCYADKYNSAGPLNQMGMHYFNAAGQPTFDLYGVGALLQAKKIAVATAPSGACTGRNGAGAVTWLFLQDNGAGVSHGVSAVYRVETAGGNAPATCSGVSGAFTSDYSAEYWFYG